MGTDPEKINVTRGDVLTALGMPSHSKNLQTAADVARWVVVDVYEVKNVYDGKTAMWHVHQANLKRLLAEMVADGSLVLRTGEEWWRHGAPTWLGRSNGRYYALPEQAQAWQEDADRKRAEARRAQADVYAKGFLVERHREEYDCLVAEYLAEAETEQAG